MPKLALGNYDDAIKYCECALRLSPRDPTAFVAENAIATAHFLSDRYGQAFSWAATALR